MAASAFFTRDCFQKHMLTFLKPLYWWNAVITDFKRTWNNTLKKHVFTIILLCFMCDDLPFIKTTQQTLKPSKKMFQFPGWMRKNFIPGNFSWRISAETWDASCFKKGIQEKQQSVPKLATYRHWKIYFFRT